MLRKMNNEKVLGLKDLLYRRVVYVVKNLIICILLINNIK